MDIPRYYTLDSSPAIFLDGYRFISKRCAELQTDIFETRLMLRDAICGMGEDVSRMFYVPGRFTRRGALPKTALTLLQDKGSVAMQDGRAHRRRKDMFMSCMSPESARRLADEAAGQMRRASWSGDVVLMPAIEEILCRAVCRWAGVPLSDEEAPQRTRELHATIDGAGSIGPRNWRGHLLRAKAERWAGDVIRKVRDGEIGPPDGSALRTIAEYRSENGQRLSDEVAAVELINVLRPTVAITYYITYAALALHEHPHVRTGLEDEDRLEAFVNEVRRYYPFFPFVAGRVREPFQWRGREFSEGRWVLLDIYGTNHDPRLWDRPNEFRPERFVGWEGNPYTLIPQGGGEHRANHRCAGEWITIEVTKAAVRFLTQSITYEVPSQDLTVSLTRMPTFPRSRFILRNPRSAAD